MTAPPRPPHTVAVVEFVGGPRCGDTETVPLTNGNAPPVMHDRYVHAGRCYPADTFVVARCPTVSGRHRYEWEHTHTGLLNRPSTPCCPTPQPGCPYWPGAAP